MEKIAKVKPETDGTLNRTLARLDEWGIDKAVCLSIATKPQQQRILTEWSVKIQAETAGRIIPFGSVHPDADDALEELEFIKKSGLKGIKLHPDYQNFYIDDEKAYPIYQKCAELDLPIVFHAGLDIKCPDDIHATPERVIRVLKLFPKTTMVMAHLGGNMLWEEVYEKLAGISENLYFDTAIIGAIIAATSNSLEKSISLP